MIRVNLLKTVKRDHHYLPLLFMKYFYVDEFKVKSSPRCCKQMQKLASRLLPPNF